MTNPWWNKMKKSFSRHIGFWTVVIICLQWNKGVFCNSNSIFYCIFSFITQLPLFIHSQTVAVNWSQVFPVILTENASITVLNYCRSLTEWKLMSAMLGHAPWGVKAVINKNEIVLLSPERSDWSGTNTARAAWQRGDGLFCHDWIPRPYQQTKRLLWKLSWQRVDRERETHISSCF